MLLCQLIQICDTSRRLLRETAKDPETANLDRIRKLVLKKGADVNCSNRTRMLGLRIGFTPLGNACQTGNKEVASWLLDHGKAKSHIARYRERGEPDPPLRVASQEGHIEIVQLLLMKNETSGLLDALADACRRGHVEIALLLIETGAKSSTEEIINPTFQTAPLYLASGYGHVSIVQSLLDHGALVNRDGSAGSSTPLCTASSNGHLDVVKLLLERGADMTLTNAQGRNPFQIADQRNHPDVTKALQREGKNRSLGDYSHLIGSDVHTVATRELFSEVGKKKHPDRKQVRKIKHIIVDQKADVNCRATNGWTPIHWATAEGHFEIVKLLLNHGADKDMSIAIRGWESGDTPLFLACRNGHLDIARLLLQYKANPDCCTERGRDWAPLHWACVHGKIELVKLLIKYGAKVNRQVYGIRGDSPLFMAIEKGHVEIVELLLKNGADQTVTHEGAYFNDMQEKFPDTEKCAMDVALRSKDARIAEVLSRWQCKRAL